MPAWVWLGTDVTCIGAQYGALLMVDLEGEFTSEEVTKLASDVAGGLGLVVFGEWFNVDTMLKMKFFDDNTRSWWTPVTGPRTAHVLVSRLGRSWCSIPLCWQRQLQGGRVHAHCRLPVAYLLNGDQPGCMFTASALHWRHLQVVRTYRRSMSC